MDRADILRRIGDELGARKAELGELLSREEGKPREEGVSEVVRTAQIFYYSSGEAIRNVGEVVSSLRAGSSVEVVHEPLGVVGLITPWNFPTAIPAWKIAPALAFGNCVVFKPAESVTASAWALTEIISRSGLPAGTFNLVMGCGREAGNALVTSAQVQGISFTGSVEVGCKILEACSKNLTRCQLEMGSKNPLVVLNDADLDTAVDCAIQGAFGSTGQRCTASALLIVENGIHDSFVDGLISRMRALKVGNALDPKTDMGPLAHREQYERVLNYIRIGQAEGAKLACGGKPVSAETEGYFVQPTLFVDTVMDMQINREEIFGPVASVVSVNSYEEALAAANESCFGLCAGIVTSSLQKANHFKSNADVGVVSVNTPTAGLDFHVPFGGRRRSSYGPRELGRTARDFYTAVKTAYTRA